MSIPSVSHSTRINETNVSLNSLADRSTATVLHIINGQHYSGAERVQDLLGISMPQFGYGVEFAALLEGKFDSNRRSECPFHLVPMKGKLDFSIGRRLAKLAMDKNAHLLHAHTPRSLMAATAASRISGLPVVYTVHSPVGKDSTRWLHNKINLFVEKRSIARTNHLICVSNNVGQYMESIGIPKSKLTVIPNGVPVVEDLEEASRQSCQAIEGLPNWEYTLGTVALFRPRKGTEILLESLAKLAATGLDVGLLAVGGFESEDYQSKLMKLAKELGIESRVFWTGFTREVQPTFSKMDLFVLPSLFGEGLPMVILESMAMGVGVVACRVEGVDQVIRPTIDGEICRPGDCNDLAEKIQRLLSNKANLLEIGMNARKRQQSHFSDQSMCRQTAAVYDKIIGL